MAAKQGLIARQFGSMSSRDRNLLAGMIAFFGLTFVLILGFTLNGWLQERTENIDQRRANYELLVEMQKQYVGARQAVLDAEVLAQRWEGKTASAFLEETSSKVGVREALTVNKQGTKKEGAVEETRYKVSLRRVSLENAISFIYDIETQGFPMAVDSTEFKTLHVKGVKVVTVTIEAIHYNFGEAK